jgi:hypothetical protein
MRTAFLMERIRELDRLYLNWFNASGRAAARWWRLYQSLVNDRRRKRVRKANSLTDKPAGMVDFSARG